jgi:hypothetical protein
MAVTTKRPASTRAKSILRNVKKRGLHAKLRNKWTRYSGVIGRVRNRKINIG